MSTTDRTMIRRSFDSLVSLLGEELAHALRATTPDVEVSRIQTSVRWDLDNDDDLSFSETLADVDDIVARVRLRAAYDALDWVRFLIGEAHPNVAMNLWPEREFRSPACRPRWNGAVYCDVTRVTDGLACRENLLPVGTVARECATRTSLNWVRSATRLLLTARDLIASLRVDRTNP